MSSTPVDLERLNLITGGDEEMVRELVDLFVGDSTARIKGLAGFVHAGDRQGLKRQIHAVKGASANMGATKLYEVCLSLEQKAPTAEADDLLRHISEVEAAMDEATRILRGA